MVPRQHMHVKLTVMLRSILDAMQAKKTKARLDSWGEFRCESGGWSPVQDVPLALNNHYWGSLGVAARFKDAIKRDPAFAIAQFPTLTEQQIEKELVHVR